MVLQRRLIDLGNEPVFVGTIGTGRIQMFRASSKRGIRDILAGIRSGICIISVYFATSGQHGRHSQAPPQASNGSQAVRKHQPTDPAIDYPPSNLSPPLFHAFSPCLILARPILDYKHPSAGIHGATPPLCLIFNFRYRNQPRIRPFA